MSLVLAVALCALAQDERPSTDKPMALGRLFGAKDAAKIRAGGSGTSRPAR